MGAVVVGGGGGIWIKKELCCYEWEKRGGVDETDTERKWVIVKGKGEDKIAIGVVYMSCDKHVDWNDTLIANLESEIREIQEEGAKVILVGDLNAHFEGEKNSPMGYTPKDANARNVQNLVERTNLEIVNHSTKCLGKWTWMQRKLKTEIDYCLVSKLGEVVEMKIDDEGKEWTCGSDHNWIQLIYRGEIAKKQSMRGEGKKKWKIDENTDWEKFREGVSDRLIEWGEEWGDQINGENIKEAYNEIIKSIHDTAEKVIGRTKGVLIKGERGKIKQAIRQRNLRKREWMREVKRDGNTTATWARYQAAVKKAAREKRRDNARKRNKFRERIIKLGKANCKQFWDMLDQGGGGERDGVHCRW